MPCDAVRVYSVDLAVANRTVLDKAIAALGWSISADGKVVTTTEHGAFRIDGAKATVNTYQTEAVNKLRVEYGKQAVNFVAGKLGWQKTNVGANKIVLKRGV